MNADELNGLRNRDKALIIYFFHDQCAPCLSLRPKVSELISKQFPEITLVYVDAMKNPEVPAGMGVFAFPTIILYFEGQESGRWSKYVSIAQLEAHISRPYALLFG
ncbi:MAG TPA: thioredoxin family protein [Bacteroidales bacterium]|nr:thioredoxin family protein [Bacteroidales bacterium]